MPTNQNYYPKRASMLKPIWVPEQNDMIGCDHTEKLVESLVSVANEVARLAISDAMSLLEKSKYYRHNIKKWSRETFRRQEAYERTYIRDYGDRAQVWIDFLDAVEKEFRPYINNIFTAVKKVMDENQLSESLLKAKLECGRVCATLAVAQFDVMMASEKRRWGVDYTSRFMPARYDGPLQTWTYICEELVRIPMSLTEDKNCQAAYNTLAKMLNDEDLINDIGAVAVHYNLEMAREYVDPEDIEELENRFRNKDNHA